MESAILERPSQDVRLGDWHPAQRPDTHQTPDPEDRPSEGSERPHTPKGKPSTRSLSSDFLPHLDPSKQPLDAAQSPFESKGSRAHDPMHYDSHDERNIVVDDFAFSARKGGGSNFSSQHQSLVEGQDDGVNDTAQHEQNLGRGPEAIPTVSAIGMDQQTSTLERPQSKDAPTGLAWDTKVSVESALDAAPESDDFAMLGTLHRTNSFPDVAPAQTSDPISHALPHSQAEDIMEEYEENIGTMPRHYTAVVASEDSSDNALGDPFNASQDIDRDGFFTQKANIQGGNISTPPDEEARYEEGLPLVPPKSQRPEQAQGKKGVLEAMANTPTAAETREDDFFAKFARPSTHDESFRPQPLDRKTTSQVLDSMHYAPHHETHDESDTIQDRPSPSNLTGGGVAVSSRNLPSQVLGAQQTGNTNNEAKTQDLAAMWQAALDDDELLDEDPSVLFEDDEEGFLEDEIGMFGAHSPSLQSIDSPDGRMQALTSAVTQLDRREPPTQNRYAPSNPQTKPSQAYGTQQFLTGPNQTLPPTVNGLSSSVSAPTGFQGLSRQQPTYGNLSSSSRPQMPNSAQSFADKSKGGYTSPYDLPMDVARPKKKNYTQQVRPGFNPSTAINRPPPPPRSSSMFNSGSPIVEAPPPLPSMPTAAKPMAAANVPASIPKPSSSAGGFFEELPSVKPRQSNHSTRRSPPVKPMNSLPHMPPQRQFDPQAAPHESTSSSITTREQTYGLIPPERASLYDNVPQHAASGPAVPAVTSRYSPAPVSQNHVPPPRTRYAVSPSGGPRAPPPQARPFQPRTSSPLAQGGAKAQQHQQAASMDVRQLVGASDPDGFASILPDRPHNSQASPSTIAGRHAPLSSSSTSSYAINTPESDQLPSTSSSSSSHPQGQQVLDSRVEFAPPRRSQTQSPGAVRSRPSLPTIPKDVYQRPASVNDWAVQKQTIPNMANVYQPSGRPRSSSKSIEYIKPTDGRENDALERWKGCPIFKFGFGGTIATTFPKQIPRYAAGRSKPLMKCSPGEVKLQSAKAMGLDDNIKDFPGPLRSKNKKKEVLEWLLHRIGQLEKMYTETPQINKLPDSRKRVEEKIVLFRIVRVLVEFDGVIEGKPPAEKEVRLILSPSIAEGPTDDLPPRSNAHLLGISRASISSSNPDPTSPQDLEVLRKILLQGEREKAVWQALDRRMWAHAMLISSTMDKSIWKQVLQEFVRQEVKSFGENTESLAALYQIFAGNWEESVDELVPPSARAGLQFVSKAAGAGPTRNALDGLDRWRETLTLALSNRSQGDSEALVALGRLLSGYGRVKAAHTCFIFARNPGLFGGADDPSVTVALLGSDHLQHPLDFSRDTDSILLTEIYEFASTVLSSSASVTVTPHLQAYKLHHAMLLAEYGYRSEAQHYCDSIASALKSTTKRSPYYHDLLFTALDDLISRLRQAPTDTSSSWMSKPSLDKVSGSFFSRVNQFIAGDDSDADSAVSGKGTNLAAGPFAGISGDTPNMSRSSSPTDLYGSHLSAPPSFAATAAGSRYAPSGQYASQGQYTSRSSLDNNGRPSQEYGRLSQHDGLKPTSLHPQPSQNLSRSSSSGNVYQQPPQLKPRPSYQPQGHPPESEGYLPTPPSQPEYMPEAAPDEPSMSLYGQEPYRPTPPPEPQPSQSPYGQYPPAAEVPQLSHTSSTPSQQPQQSSNGFSTTSSYPTPASNYEFPTPDVDSTPSGYEPAYNSGYQPPSYAPDTQPTQAYDEPTAQEKPKKKTFFEDDDDDFVARAAAVLKQEKAQKDREADEGFRKAAEADGESTPLRLPHQLTNQTIAQKGELRSKKSGWLGGWFGGAKKDDLSAPNAPNGPIKAKLGEQSSFYYDKELGKWVNKKAGEAPAAAEPPRLPPPKGPPSRAVSAAGAPPMRRDTDTPPVPPLPSTATPPISVTGPPAAGLTASPSLNAFGPASRTASPLPIGEQPAQGAGLGLVAAGLGPPSAPPSRPSTSMSNASSIDDLIGQPQARKGGTIKKGKKGRGYVDVMAK